MAKSVNYATRDYTIEPGATLQIVRQAQFVACLAASSTFKIAFDDGSESDFEAGLTYSPESGFSRILIRNPGATTLTVSLGIGAGNIRDARVTINAGVTLPTRESAPDVLTTGAVTIYQGNSQILPANPLRREVILRSGSASVTIYLKGSGDLSATTQGITLASGETITLQTSGEIRGYIPSAGGATLYFAATEWSA